MQKEILLEARLWLMRNKNKITLGSYVIAAIAILLFLFFAFFYIQLHISIYEQLGSINLITGLLFVAMLVLVIFYFLTRDERMKIGFTLAAALILAQTTVAPYLSPKMTLENRIVSASIVSETTITYESIAKIRTVPLPLINITDCVQNWAPFGGEITNIKTKIFSADGQALEKNKNGMQFCTVTSSFNSDETQVISEITETNPRYQLDIHIIAEEVGAQGQRIDKKITFGYENEEDFPVKIPFLIYLTKSQYQNYSSIIMNFTYRDVQDGPYKNNTYILDINKSTCIILTNKINERIQSILYYKNGTLSDVQINQRLCPSKGGTITFELETYQDEASCNELRRDPSYYTNVQGQKQESSVGEVIILDPCE